MDNKEDVQKKPFYKKWWVWALAVLFIFIFTSIGDTKEKVQEVKSSAILIEAIGYSTLREWNPDNDTSAIGLEILINPQDVSRDNIVDLVQSIGSQSNKAVVKVYKTRDAWDAERSETYGDIYNEGYLAFYVKNTTNSGAYRGTNEVRWMQEIGELKDLFGSKVQINN